MVPGNVRLKPDLRNVVRAGDWAARLGSRVHILMPEVKGSVRQEKVRSGEEIGLAKPEFRLGARSEPQL